MNIRIRNIDSPKNLLVILVLSLVLSHTIVAETPSPDEGADHDVRVLVLGYPLVPAMSEVRYRLKPNHLFKPIEDRLSLNTWYMASSGYLVPDPFLEVGITATCTILDGHGWTIEVGGGAAFSMDEDDSYALPLVTEFLGRYWIGNLPIALDWRLQGLLYSNGMVVDIMVPVHVVIGNSGVYLEAVPGFNVGQQFEEDITAAAPKMGIAAGLVF